MEIDGSGTSKVRPGQQLSLTCTLIAHAAAHAADETLHGTQQAVTITTIIIIVIRRRRRRRR